MPVDVKEGLIAGVDKNGVLTGIQWRVLRRYEDGGELRTTVPLTMDELRAHLGEALARQAEDIVADRVVRDGIAAERDAALAAVRELEAERETLKQERDEARSQRSEMAGRIAALERPQ